jgi:tetratricopeptide (TPR) repeat protein
LLDGFSMVWQDFNRCSAGALTILLSHYDWGGDYATTIRGLNPNIEDVSVRLDEMIRFARGYNLNGIARIGGTIDLLKVLVANGFPVLVENTYYDGDDINKDWMGHNRVIMGYDDALGVLYSFDSLLGAGPDGTGRAIEYADFDNRWRAFNRDYLVLYHDTDLPALQALLGDQWDETANAEWTLAQATGELNGEHPDSFAAFNAGTALVALERYEEAAEMFDRARNNGLPWRFMWYQFGPFDAYLQTGRYQDAIDLAHTVLNATPGVEEMYYYVALAYAAMGDTQRAESNLEVAVMRNNYYDDATNALTQLRNGVVPTPLAHFG